MNLVALVLLAVASQLPLASSFAEWMLTDYCSRRLVVGQVIMNEEVIESTDRTVDVFRGEEQLPPGSPFVLGETLAVKISNPLKEYVYEVNGGATFEDGGCDGKRAANQPKVVMHLPTTPSPSGSISIIVAWAAGHAQVRLSKPFVLSNPSLETPALSTKPEQEEKPAAALSLATATENESDHEQASASTESPGAEDHHAPTEEDKSRLRGKAPSGGKFACFLQDSSDLEHRPLLPYLTPNLLLLCVSCVLMYARTEHSPMTVKTRAGSKMEISSLYNTLSKKVGDLQDSWHSSRESPSVGKEQQTLEKAKHREPKYRLDKKGRKVLAMDDDTNLSEFAKQKLGPHHPQIKARRQRNNKLSKMRQLGYIAVVIVMLVVAFFAIDCIMRNRFKAFKIVRQMRGENSMDE